MKPLHRHRSAGVSLIEALVALAVMAFGILGVTGIQATLRANADISRQRTEAVRIAQQAVEQWRAFTTLSSTAGQLAYDDIDIGTHAAESITDPLYNTTYTLKRTVTAAPTGRAKTLTVEVAWTDRAGLTQKVQLNTLLAGISPEIAGALLVPGDASPDQQANGRSAAIPLGALDNGDGTSSFSPPGTSGVTWVFNNITGVITQICNPTCTASNAFFLGGFVLFSTGAAPSASNPTSVPFPVTVTVNLTAPSATAVTCASAIVPDIPSYVEYDCAIPIPAPPATQSWTGTVALGVSPPSSGVLSSALADATAVNVKVCRYTTAASDTPPGGNPAHPKTYVGVTGALPFQNYLITSAGDDSSPYGCPSDGTPTIITYRHQPAS